MAEIETHVHVSKTLGMTYYQTPTAPTPVGEKNTPDLHSLIASRIVVCVVIFMMKMLIIMSSAHMIKEAEKLRAGL